MKRIAVPLLVILLASGSALALDTSHRGNRIGILQPALRYQSHDAAMSSSIRKYLRDELRKGGFDAFDANATYDDLDRNGANAADYYIDIASSDAQSGSYGGIGVGGDNVAVDIGLVVARVAAEVRVYNGKTLELVQRFDLGKSKRGIAPTGVGIGGSHVLAWIATPFVEMAQFRAAARDVAHDAAARVTQYVQAN
jgi:hypothetical protein